ALLLVWQLVGLWRSAQAYAWERKRLRQSSFWARAAQFMVIVAIVQNYNAFSTSGKLQLEETYRMAFLGDPDIPPNQLTILDGCEPISLDGGIKYGLARDIETVLRASPAAAVLRLS